MAIEVILFDLDDTLVWEVRSASEAFRLTCAAVKRYGVDPEQLPDMVRQRARELWYASEMYGFCKAIGISSWEGLWAQFEGEGEELRKLREWVGEYRREAWRRALADVGVKDESFVEELAERFGVERRKRHLLLPGAERVLQELGRRYRLAMISNGASDLQREKIAGAGIGHYFEVIVISGDYGVGKPDERIFDKTLELLQVKADKVVIVGNSLHSDIQGGKQAGMRTVWINVDGTDREPTITADVEIRELVELLEIF